MASSGGLLRSTGQHIITDLRTEVIGHLLRLPASFYDAQPVGRLVTRATNDIAAVEELFTGVLITVVRDCLLIIGGMASCPVGVASRPGGARLHAAGAAGELVVPHPARDINRALRSRFSQLNSFLAESLSGWRTVQATVQEVAMYTRFAAINQAEFLTSLAQMRLNGLFLPSSPSPGRSALRVVLLVGGHAVIWGWVTIGGLVAFTAYIEMAFAPIRDLAEKYNLTQAAVAAGERIFMVLDEPQSSVSLGACGQSASARVTVSGVSFRYPAQSRGYADSLGLAGYLLHRGPRRAHRLGGSDWIRQVDPRQPAGAGP
jgi:ATP-binding cassette subfamily B multidrug efflux pump